MTRWSLTRESWFHNTFGWATDHVQVLGASFAWLPGRGVRVTNREVLFDVKIRAKSKEKNWRHHKNTNYTKRMMMTGMTTDGDARPSKRRWNRFKEAPTKAKTPVFKYLWRAYQFCITLTKRSVPDLVLLKTVFFKSRQVGSLRQRQKSQRFNAVMFLKMHSDRVLFWWLLEALIKKEQFC